VPGFLAKNQVPNTSRRLVIIPSLSATVDKTFPDRTLCPVRALKFYVDRTRPPTVRRGRQHLFISYAEGYSKEIAPTTISRWIVSTIKLAYQLTGNSQSLLRLCEVSQPILFGEAIWAEKLAQIACPNNTESETLVQTPIIRDILEDNITIHRQS
jgi:hypothetical protein